MASANIVGYTTLEVTKEYSILALNFQNVNGGAISIQDAIPVVDGMTAGNAQSASDSIQIMQDDGTYANYYLSNGYNGKASTPNTLNKWVKGTNVTTPTTDTLKEGTAFWYVSKAFGTNANATPYNITVAGSVLMASASSREIAQKYMLIANPYPADVLFNDGIKITAGATPGNAASAADQIQIMKDDGTYENYYLSNGYNGKASTPNTANKWVNGNAVTMPTTDAFPAGKGAWFVSQTGSATVEFNSPIAE